MKTDEQVNAKKTPTRPHGKFFTTSPKERRRKNEKKTKTKTARSTEDLSWFDSDTLFGFGNED